MSGTLFVVATPIGNLEDITLRALRVLREVALVAAEDTRRTGNLLRHYEIDTPLVSVHEHNEHRRAGELITRLHRGESIALVSDAGTPGISDPGAKVVHAARLAGIRVEPIPGPSAVTAILSASGLSLDRFAFGGFPPTVKKDRREWLNWVVQARDIAVVCFEAPHRIRRTLTELAEVLGKRPIVLARELTKLHEQWLWGTAADLADRSEASRGEFVFIIGPDPDDIVPMKVPTDAEIEHLFGQITEIGVLSRREAIRWTAARLGLASKTVYAVIERAKESGKNILD